MGIWRIARKRIWVGLLFVSFFVLSHWYAFIIHEKLITCESLGFILINVIFWLFFVFFLCSYGIWIWSTWISLSSHRICFLFNYVSQSEPLGIVLYIELSFQLFCGKRWNDKYKSIAIIIGDFFTYCKAFFFFHHYWHMRLLSQSLCMEKDCLFWAWVLVCISVLLQI